MIKKILFLTQKMSMGFGVSVVVHQLTLELVRLGVDVSVVCLEHDGSILNDYPINIIGPDADDLDGYITQHKITHVIAHTSPYFEVLPSLKAKCRKVVWEHGDPTPDLFPFDGHERKQIASRKRLVVYPNVDQVVAISEFVRADIGWPQANIIYNGCDHIETVSRSDESNSRLKVGTLMRLGAGESYYKGNELYLDLVNRFQGQVDIDFFLMGRGEPEDASPFIDAGVSVILNATDEERSRYLADLNIFVSLSLWEGFNLPLVEAALSGALPLALDTGAHPEVTPFIFSNLSELEAFVRNIRGDRAELLSEYARRTKSQIVDKFKWKAAAKQLVKVVLV